MAPQSLYLRAAQIVDDSQDTTSLLGVLPKDLFDIYQDTTYDHNGRYVSLHGGMTPEQMVFTLLFLSTSYRDI